MNLKHLAATSRRRANRLSMLTLALFTAAPTSTALPQQELIDEGRETFRFDTFGDEVFWGDGLRLHEAIAGAAGGGVGPGISPAAALGVGVKLDADALPPSRLQALLSGQIDLNDPAVTVGLIRAKAVVGLTGFFDPQGQLTSIGVNCALCHSTVDDSFAPGIGSRLDGWPNRDLDVGTIISLAPDVSPLSSLLGVPETTVRQVLQSWGPGRFDGHLLLDGQAFRPDGATASVLIPPMFGLGGVNLSTYNGWGGNEYWTPFVAVLELGGQGKFFDPRLNDPVKYPVAAAAGFANVTSAVDRVTPKLPGLTAYQASLTPPPAPASSFDPIAAAAGEALFNGVASCSTCHVPPLYTEPGYNLHTPTEIGIDAFQADRGPVNKYRTTPPRGMVARQTGGFYHDGRFGTLLDVVNHYDSHLQLGLTAAQQNELVEFVKSL